MKVNNFLKNDSIIIGVFYINEGKDVFIKNIKFKEGEQKHFLYIYSGSQIFLINLIVSNLTAQSNLN